MTHPIPEIAFSCPVMSNIQTTNAGDSAVTARNDLRQPIRPRIVATRIN
jgi:hypothetical protein